MSLSVLWKALSTVYNIAVGIVVSIAGIIIWETMRIFGPKGIYEWATKLERRIRLRNAIYSIRVIKSYETHNYYKNDVNLLEGLVKSKLEEVFDRFSIEFFDNTYTYRISAKIERDGFEVRITVEIESPDEYNEEVRIVILQKANAKFKEIEKLLNVLFWNLADISQSLIRDNIFPSTDKVKVEIESRDVKIYLELLDKFKDNCIVGTNVSIRKKDELALLSIEDKMGPELAKKLQEIVLLGHL